MSDITVQDVQNLDAKGFTGITDARIESFIEDAERETDSMYSGRNSQFPTLVGDRDIFVKNLAAHKVVLAQGGEAQSESSSGGSTSYQQGQSEDYLTLTRYGETAKRHLRDEQSIAIVRNYR